MVDFTQWENAWSYFQYGIFGTDVNLFGTALLSDGLYSCGYLDAHGKAVKTE